VNINLNEHPLLRAQTFITNMFRPYVQDILILKNKDHNSEQF